MSETQGSGARQGLKEMASSGLTLGRRAPKLTWAWSGLPSEGKVSLGPGSHNDGGKQYNTGGNVL